MVDFEIKDYYKFDDLLRIMEILRAPDGCMWDREHRCGNPIWVFHQACSLSGSPFASRYFFAISDGLSFCQGLKSFDAWYPAW